MATTPFVYREAAPGQQAVSYAQMQANADLERNKMVNDMYSNILRNATTQSANMGNMALTRSQMDRDTGRDAQRKLEFDQSMQLERDRIAAIESANKQRNADIQAEKDAEHDRQYDSWLRYAESINARGLQPGERLPAGLIVENGKVVPLMRPRVAATPPGIGSHMDSINSIRNRIRGNLGVNPVPSPGLRAPSPTDFQIPISQLGQPEIVEPSPYEQSFPTTVPQSEILRFAYPDNYEDQIRQIQVPFR
jgi:hypothetical protein